MSRKPLIAAGILIGLGMGGFVDGILFHQIFQLHGMLSAIFPLDSTINIELNMVWDGLFHTLTWMMTAIGIIILWNAGKKRQVEVEWCGYSFAGSLLMGWGIFNLVEGIIDHHVLGIHHVVENLGLSVFDYVYLASGLLLIVIGLGMIIIPVRRSISSYPAASADTK